MFLHTSDGNSLMFKACPASCLRTRRLQSNDKSLTVTFCCMACICGHMHTKSMTSKHNTTTNYALVTSNQENANTNQQNKHNKHINTINNSNATTEHQETLLIYVEELHYTHVHGVPLTYAIRICRTEMQLLMHVACDHVNNDQTYYDKLQCSNARHIQCCDLKEFQIPWNMQRDVLTTCALNAVWFQTFTQSYHSITAQNGCGDCQRVQTLCQLVGNTALCFTCVRHENNIRILINDGCHIPICQAR